MCTGHWALRSQPVPTDNVALDLCRLQVQRAFRVHSTRRSIVADFADLRHKYKYVYSLVCLLLLFIRRKPTGDSLHTMRARSFVYGHSDVW